MRIRREVVAALTAIALTACVIGPGTFEMRNTVPFKSVSMIRSDS